jgi:hypothetical protein
MTTPTQVSALSTALEPASSASTRSDPPAFPGATTATTTTSGISDARA